MSHFKRVSHTFAAPEFKSCDPVKGHHHPGAQGEDCLPRSRGVCPRQLGSGEPGREGERASGAQGVLSSCCSDISGMVGGSSVQLSKRFLRTFRELLTVERPVPSLKGCDIVVQTPYPGSTEVSPSL